ncbi:U3 snoRNP protein [Sporothrix eucalyptigena]|uniref:U3 small nucleolar RNA-associated protein 22 n=1 Tax=Sporothrix eucalyptigena TaxID=1812306 RepID=A0ABP0BPA0_9PEZI
MDSNPAKRRKTDHATPGEAYSALPFDAAAASAGLFRPSTFILETAELLQQSRVDYGKLLPNAEELLRNVKTAVESVDTHGPVLISKASTAFEKKNSIKIPYPTPRPADSSQLKLSIEPPAHCNVVGSYVLKTMIRSQREFAVDMIVEMPKTLFQDKDYLNLRYFYKRAYYLAHIAKAVSRSAALSNAVTDVSFAYLGDNQLQPILVITPKTTTAKDDASSKPNKSKPYECKIRIIPCCPDGVFPAAKLLANKNCLRPDGASSTATETETDDTKPLPPTPFYNATLKAEAAYVPYLKLLHQAQKTCSAFVDACLLGHVWLQQRGFGSSLARGGFGSFEFAALVALLLQTGSKKRTSSASASSKKAASILSPSLSSTQIFKAVVQFLASTDFRTKPCILGGLTPDAGIDALKEGTPVLFDAGSRQLNIAYKMSAWSAGLLRQHAKRTHELLKDESVIDQFTPTFIARADIALEAFDMVVRVRCPSSTAASSDSSNLSRHGAVWDFGDSVFQTIKRAMGDRAKLVHVQLPSSSAWSIGKSLPETSSKASDSHVILGIEFDASNMSRHIDHGPPAEDKKEARKFREFWGDRAELRRFKDGSILETLVWTAGQSASALCEEITRYILGHRLGLTTEGSIEVLAGSDADGSFSSLVPITPVVDAAAFTLAREAFATLEADIRALEDLPLHIRQIAPTDAALRSSTISPPAVQSAKAVLHPMEVALFFEASGKWPDNLAAIQRAKMAFLLRIGESLEAAKAEKGDAEGGVETFIGLENNSNGTEASSSGLTNLAYLDIFYRENAAFRLRIHSDLEEAILSQQTHDKTLDQHTRTTSAHLLAAQRRMFGMLPLHNQTISTYCTRFPALSPTIRLVKRWFSAHKLTSHVSDELVELIVLHVFLRPYPWLTPASPAPGLLRVLQFLARWDWRTEPLMVDTSSMAPMLPEEEEAAAAAKAIDPRTRLEAWRKIDPNMNHTVLFVSATHETSGTAFTTDNRGGISRPQPSKVVASRMTSLARAACRLVKEKDVTSTSLSSVSVDSDFDPALLFQPSLGDFDVLLHLSPRVIKRLVKGDIAENGASDAAKPRRSIYKNLDARTGRELHALPAHPVQLLLDQLNQVYGGASAGGGGVGPIVFFYGAPQDEDKDGDHIIAALWNPQVHPRTFRINVPCSFRPVAASKADKKKKAKSGTTDDEANAEPMIEVNRDGILAEIARIGGTLIDQIEIVKE